MIGVEDFIVPDEGVLTNYVNMPGYRLVGLYVPLHDSATIAFNFAKLSTGVGAVPIQLATHGAANASITLGTAAVTAGWYPVPPEVGEASAHGFIALLFSAAQNGGPYTITGYFRRDT